MFFYIFFFSTPETGTEGEEEDVVMDVSHTLGSSGRKNSKPNIGSHGHNEGTRPDKTRKTPKDLSVHESEEHGCGE